ncbi:MAG: bifunctional adenosylcobinamide kinase/adenosylcobinamide-phosphate guanylyltransferase [Thermodesulfovibrionales bacterium]|nr:bifunctional adenosylcobinamide kinase/adenosylcobinamide-phosphate guanylyltransferase [Thermodesulfovibrionales bacterium]
MLSEKSKLVFIIGGARSGKSSLALKVASPYDKKAYIATAEPLDREMEERILNHKKQRGEGWDLYEEPIRLVDTLKIAFKKYQCIVIDCLTLWLSNILIRQREDLFLKNEIDRFIDILHLFCETYGMVLIIVSNEVGMGIVPDNELSRRFRDLAGLLNQRVANMADEVYLSISGLEIKIKG